MKIAELTGAALDCRVAKAEGVAGEVADGHWFMIKDGGLFRPSSEWATAGPIIERERIALFFEKGEWVAGFDLEACDGTVYDEYDSDSATLELEHRQTGATPLIAAMRAFVARKLGEEAASAAD